MKHCKHCTHPVICDSHGCGNENKFSADRINREKLVCRLRDEADKCRNDGADDIANLLDEAASELEA